MSDRITFLPWLRRGLAQALENPDPLSGALPRGATIDAWVDVERARAPQTLRLHGPDAVAGLAPGQILREEPRPDSTGVEPNYFAFVELTAPDLPWMYTPARHEDLHGRLRPWLVLVVVREQEGVGIVSGAGGALPVLCIEPPAAPAAELPDLADSWAWAHVHSLVEADDIADAVTRATGEVFARLLSPRRLLPRAGWIACVVPAFDGGRLRGLGLPQPDSSELRPAWEQPLADRIELPVYHHWRFETGAAGDFEALCRRLQPDGDGAEMGLHAMDIGEPGLVAPAKRRVVVDMEGALHTLEARPRPWEETHKEDFQRELGELLDAGAAPYDTEQDPVVSPPLYGCRPAGATALPAGGWLHELNADPVLRAAAGLGARAVRAAQEALVAAAWEQAGDLRPTVAALNRGRLGAEVGRSLTRRASALADPDLLQLTARLHPVLRSAGGTIRAELDESALPRGLVTPAHLRRTRPGTPLARDWAKQAGAASRLVADHVQVTLDATAAAPRPGVAGALEFAHARVPAGAWLDDPTLRLTSATSAPRAIPPPPPKDVSQIADSVRDVLDPLASVRARLLARVPGLDALIGDDTLPTTVPLGPVFTDPLYWDLLALGSSWVLPGIESLARNRVRLVEADPEFVGAFMVGANHELGRELLWRGYPVDLRATFFHRFWSYIDATRTDIPDLHGWESDDPIRANMSPGATSMTVVVVRGDLVRRHPTARYFLQAEVGGEPVEASEIEPDFLGTLGRDTTFFGFSTLDPETVRARYFFVIEEQAGAPRFGFDKVREAQFENEPVTWNGAGWGHLVSSWDEYDALIHARSDHPRLLALGDINGTTWGYNAAHVARASWQRPFRMFIHASVLV